MIAAPSAQERVCVMVALVCLVVTIGLQITGTLLGVAFVAVVIGTIAMLNAVRLQHRRRKALR